MKKGSMFDKHLKSFALVFLSLIISLLLAEVILRQMVPIDPGQASKYRVPHPVFGWTLKPNAKYSNRMRESTVAVEYNSKGWRDTEHQFENPDNKFRVLVLGDSFMEAYSVGIHDGFFKKLEALAGEKGLDIEVINLGVGGYGTLQEYLVFQEIGRKYNPDLVLLGMYLSNDIRNNSYPLESMFSTGGTKARSRPFLDLLMLPDWKVSQVDYEGAYQRYLKRDSLLRKLRRNSALLQSLKKARGEIVRSLNPPGSPDKSLALEGVHYCDEPQEYTEAWAATEIILKRFANDMNGTKAKMLVFTVPALKEVDVDAMKSVQDGMTDPAALCLEDSPGYGRLKDILDSLKIEYVDLLPDFRKSGNIEGIDLFRKSDRHWNENGHALAAKKVLSGLIVRNYISGAVGLNAY